MSRSITSRVSWVALLRGGRLAASPATQQRLDAVSVSSFGEANRGSETTPGASGSAFSMRTRRSYQALDR